VLEAISREICIRCPWELLYADDFVISAESLDELLARLKGWKTEMEAKGLKTNLSKTKGMVSGPELNTLKYSFPCAVCRKGVGRNSILCRGCNLWVHKRCSKIKGKLTEDPNFKCQRCQGEARPIDGRPMTAVNLDDGELEVVDSFCYLGDMLCAGGGSELTTVTRCNARWRGENSNSYYPSSQTAPYL